MRSEARLPSCSNPAFLSTNARAETAGRRRIDTAPAPWLPAARASPRRLARDKWRRRDRRSHSADRQAGGAAFLAWPIAARGRSSVRCALRPYMSVQLSMACRRRQSCLLNHRLFRRLDLDAIRQNACLDVTPKRRDLSICYSVGECLLFAHCRRSLRRLRTAEIPSSEASRSGFRNAPGAFQT